MLLEGNSFQNVTFFRNNPQKVIEEQHSLRKSQKICIFNLACGAHFQFNIHD